MAVELEAISIVRPMTGTFYNPVTLLKSFSISREYNSIWDFQVSATLQSLTILPALPYLFLTLTDEFGNSISNASIKIYDNDNNLIVNTTSNDNGGCYGIIDQHASSPIRLEIEKNGYQPYKQSFNVNSRLSLHIALLPVIIEIDQEVIQ